MIAEVKDHSMLLDSLLDTFVDNLNFTILIDSNLTDALVERNSILSKAYSRLKGILSQGLLYTKIKDDAEFSYRGRSLDIIVKNVTGYKIESIMPSFIRYGARLLAEDAFLLVAEPADGARNLQAT